MEDFYLRYSGRIVTLFMILTCGPVFLFDSVSNEAVLWTYKYLTIPILLAIFYMYFYKFPIYKEDSGKIEGPIVTLISAFALPFFIGGFIFGINCLGPSENVRLEGNITKMKVNNSRFGPGYLINFEEKKSGETLSVYVPRKEYHLYQIRGYYSQSWKVGMFGFLYK